MVRHSISKSAGEKKKSDEQLKTNNWPTLPASRERCVS